MVDTALLFERPPTQNTNLVFGENVVAARVDITILGALPGLTANIRLFPPVEIGISGTLPVLSAAIAVRPALPVVVVGTLPQLSLLAQMSYHTNTQRPTVSRVNDTAQIAVPAEFGNTQQQQHALQTGTATQVGFSEADIHVAGNTSGFAAGSAVPNNISSNFSDAVQTRDNGTTGKMQDGDRQWLKFFSQFQEADRIAAARLGGRFQDGIRTRTDRQVHLFQEAARLLEQGYTGHAGAAASTPIFRGGVFQDARVPPIGVTLIPVVPVTPPISWDTSLLFACPPLSYPALIFGALQCYIDIPVPEGLVVVPVQRVYIVINNASLRRVDGNIHLPTFGMSLSLDVDSWTWGFNASLPDSTLSSLEPAFNGAPVEVEAMVNGVPYRALVESITRNRSFGKSSISVQGRGKTALLDVPYSPVSNFTNIQERTAQQIMGDVLSVNGVPMPWTVNWGLTDWMVPTGVFSHQGSYIGALTAIAGAAGGYLQPHASNQSISVMARYPSTPWTWNTVTPDFELPSSVTTTEGIAWVEKARYNRVFVSGAQQGVLGQITRAGTAGDLVAPMVTDSLITHADAARQRGLSVLANTGRQANVSLKLPVLAETGIITPGKFVRYVDGGTTRVGIVRSVGVDIASPEIFQTLGIETHVY